MGAPRIANPKGISITFSLLLRPLFAMVTGKK
jgi:hypothetical protein